MNVFDKPDEQDEDCFRLALERKRRMLSNVYIPAS